MSIANLTPSQLRQAADLQEQIAKLNTQLAAIFGSEVKAPAIKATKPAKKGGMSAAGKAKIAAAQKLRWAKVNAAKAKPAPKAAKPVKAVKKGGMSAEGKARIVAAQKLRWAKIKAAKTAAKPAPIVKPVVKVVVAPKTAAKTIPVIKPVPAPKLAAKAVKVKRVISSEARAKMAAAAKAMWAAKKAKK
jgi:hypothetical protein